METTMSAAGASGLASHAPSYRLPADPRSIDSSCRLESTAVLADTVLADTVLADTVLADTVLADTVLAKCEIVLHKIPLDRRHLALQQVVYSIRLPRHPRRTRCPRCGARFLAVGPTGYADERPICDPCLLESEKELGMVLALVSVVRTYGAMKAASSRQHWDALELVGAFAHIYERFAAKSCGPARPFHPERSQWSRSR